MAKPGSSAAAAIAGGVDLGAVKAAQASIPPEKAADVQRKAELSKKMRCAGCGERIGTGFRFHKFTAIRDPADEEKWTGEPGHAWVCPACSGALASAPAEE
jgi:hypothetical protein